jgi:hypothetical protein
MARGECSICAAPANVRQAIDDSLDKGDKLRPLATRSGLSRATLSRHNRRCRVRTTLENYRHASGPQATIDRPGKFFTLWPGEKIPDWLAADVPVFVVEYAAPLPGRKPEEIADAPEPQN